MRDGIWTVELRSRLAGRHLAANLAKSPNLTFIHRSCLTDDHKRRERCEEQLVQVQVPAWSCLNIPSTNESAVGEGVQFLSPLMIRCQRERGGQERCNTVRVYGLDVPEWAT